MEIIKMELTVTMLGPSGVGKTAFLAVSSRMLGPTTNNLTDLALLADSESEAILAKHYKSLEELVRSFSTLGSRGVKGTTAPQDFTFKFERRGFLGNREPLSLKFIDVPGGYLSNPNMKDKRDYYVDVVSKSGATIIVVDTLALMHSNGRFNEQRNQVQEVTRLVQDAYDKGANESKLIIFVPIKCETYLLEGEGRGPQKIHEALKSKYDKLLREYLLPKALNVAVAVTPVKTVGSVIYNGYKLDDYGGIEDWDLRKIYEDAPMDPEYAEEPIRFLLRFLFCQFLKGQNSSIFGSFNNLLGRNEDLKEAVRKFAAMRPGNHVPREILQGHHLLDLSRSKK